MRPPKTTPQVSHCAQGVGRAIAFPAACKRFYPREKRVSIRQISGPFGFRLRFNSSLSTGDYEGVSGPKGMAIQPRWRIVVIADFRLHRIAE